MSGVVEQQVPEGYQQTELGLLPSDWGLENLSKLTTLMTNGFVGTAKTHYTDGSDGVLYIQGYNVEANSFNFRGIKKVTPGFHKRQSKSNLREGDVLMVQTGDVGLTTIVPKELEGSNCHALIILRFKSKDLSPLYFAYYLNSSEGRARLVELEVGTTMKHINVGDLLHFPVPVPPTIKEQTAIANALSDVDALITSLEKLISKKRAIKTAAMQQLLTGKKRLPPFDQAHTGYKQTELGEIPEDWEVFPFFQMVDIAKGQVSPKNEPFRSMVLVGPKHVDSGTGKLLFTESAYDQGAKSGKYLFQAGDVLYGKINPYLMKATLVSFDGLCSADMYPLRPTENLSSGFLLAVILGEAFTKYAISVSTRSGMPKINRKEFSEYKFVAPTDVREQDSIAAVFTAMDEELDVLNNRLNKTQQIKQGMMQELLTGRTRLV